MGTQFFSEFFQCGALEPYCIFITISSQSDIPSNLLSVSLSNCIMCVDLLRIVFSTSLNLYAVLHNMLCSSYLEPLFLRIYNDLLSYLCAASRYIMSGYIFLDKLSLHEVSIFPRGRSTPINIFRSTLELFPRSIEAYFVDMIFFLLQSLPVAGLLHTSVRMLIKVM